MVRFQPLALAAWGFVSDVATSPNPPSSGPHWYSPATAPVLPPISAKRAYTEVLFVFGAFFATGIIAAALILANRTQDVQQNGSWGIYMATSVSTIFQIGLAVVLVWLLCERRGVTFADLGVSVPRLPDGRLAVSRTIRIASWAFAAEFVGGVVNHLLQSGHLPNQQSNAPELIFSVFDSLQAGIIEELVVLAFVVVTLRQAGRPLWEITAVALILRGSYHIYYGPGVFGILLWASIYYWIYLRTRALVPLMVCHALWDLAAFLGSAAKAVAVLAFLGMASLWIVGPILWLIERSNRKVSNVTWATQADWQRQNQWPGQTGWPGQNQWPPQNGWPPRNGWPPQNGWPAHPGVPTVPPPHNGWPAQTPAPAAPAAEAAGTVTAVPPGWHADPGGLNCWRWWDGQRWTEHLSHHSISDASPSERTPDS